MLQKLIITILCVYSLTGHCDNPIKLQPGPNYLDFNNDGLQDIVFKGLYDNSTSHPDTTYTFYIKSKEGHFLHTPIGENIQNITFWDEKVSGLGYLFRDLQVFKIQNKMVVVIATKTLVSNFDKSPVTLTYYHLTESPDGPGQIPFRWVEYKSSQTKQQYESVESAFNEVK
ncbi:carbapenem self-resistance protein CarG family protein [Spartinivicinus poritis]|uniref:Uncharacterized protein n=1 Tax=Spartinivicinus poritis TaxID=2994640 RepID=A0ABT5UBC0_9GAMM|nr:hypothetical protein [Spartinivicinus sp. A2-2]MDE1463676.1 hypothetical protein [Spartinivicinus sp. A2-2]